MAKALAASRLASQPDTYFFSLAQHEDNFAVIGSDDTLRLFNPASLTATQTIASCNKGVQCLLSQGHYLCTAGRDAQIRGWDARLTQKVFEIREAKSAGFSAIACHDHYIAAGTESTKEGLGDVSVQVYDIRKPTSVLRSYEDSHTDTITDLAWHPSQKNLLLSGSTDGLLSIFDMDHADEEDAIQQVLNPRSAVHCSGFLTDDQAFVLSTDEQFTIYGLNKTGTAEDVALPVIELGDLRSQLDCMYVVGLVQASQRLPIMLAHGHNEKQTLRITTLNQPQYSFGQTIDLPGAHGEEVVRDVRFAQQTTVLSCGEDGHVRVWDISSVDQASPTNMDIDETPKSTKKKSRKEKKQAERFTPY